MDLVVYTRPVHYYETDQMGIVHHANYIHWMEEARIDFLNQIQLPYDEMERQGLLSPVLSINCQYHTPAKFGESVKIKTMIESYRGVRFTISYQILDEKDDTLRAKGESTHCFVNAKGHPISLKKQNPKLYESLQAIVGVQGK